MAHIICITGTDGSGKNTLIKGISENLNSVAIANIWDLLEEESAKGLFKSKKEIDHYLCGLSSNARLLFLAHALQFSIDKALSSNKEFILINAYYYKYFATELALGASTELVLCLMNNFPLSDQTIFLEAKIEDIYKRKKYYSRYECGLVNEANALDFINFQNRAVPFWNIFNKKNWTIINAINSPEEILAEALKTIKST